MIEVVRVGGIATIRDGGRPGRRAEGIPLGGYADVARARLANALVGTLADGPVLECAFAGPTLRFCGANAFALTGDWRSARRVRGDVEDEVRAGRTYRARPGEVLRLGALASGCRGYLAVAGRWSVDRVLGSASPLMVGGAHHPATSTLAAGDTLRVAGPVDVAGVPIWRVRTGEVAIPLHMTLAVAGGPEGGAARAPYAFAARLRRTWWRVAAGSNRTGLRLEPPPGAESPFAWASPAAEAYSAPVLPGTVQALPTGGLIVTHVDGQTIGGYPRVGVVDPADVGLLAQAVPGRSRIRLAPANPW